MQDHALVRHLQADILLACGDSHTARALYNQAADLYCKDKRVIHACAVYEYLLEKYPAADDIRAKLAILKAQLLKGNFE